MTEIMSAFIFQTSRRKRIWRAMQKRKKMTEGLLDGWMVIDALSDYAFYERGLVEHPVPANNHIQPFADHGVPDLWTYYCCAQGVEVPNRFFSMPSARNRIMGLLMYLYEIKGFLHWGYNFYNSGFSRKHIDPFYDTHADYSFPSGDAFLVYPGPDGEAYSSLRAQVQLEGLQDLRALQKLEEKIGRRTGSGADIRGTKRAVYLPELSCRCRLAVPAQGADRRGALKQQL